MRLRLEISIGAGILLLLQLLTAFSAIGLLSRVSPAVEQILRENVYSIEAVEEMLVVLAADPGPPAGARFDAALRRAEGNVTIAEERPLLDAIRADRAAALKGDVDARRRVVENLQALSGVNRDSMQTANQNARRLGVTGTWAAVFLGFGAFLVGVGVYRRLRDRVEAPITEFDRALIAARKGDTLRRCQQYDAPEELTRMRQNLNWLLDRIVQFDRSDDPIERLALLALLDQRSAPTLLIHRREGVRASNQAALKRFADKSLSVQALLPTLTAERPAWPGWELLSIPGAPLFLATYTKDDRREKTKV